MTRHRTLLALFIAAAIGLAGAGCSTPPAPCDATVSSVSAVQGAVNAASNGQTVCLANGTYGQLSVSASKSVNIQSATPGGATIAGASLSGSGLTLSRFKVIGGEVTVTPGSSGITIFQNTISGGYFGVDAGPTSSTNVSDVNVIGNRFVGPFGEDGIRANRYHDADGNGYGLLVLGNEFTNIRENGNHSDCLQSVWGGDHIEFAGNYLHDNRCQGFFIKDQPGTVDYVTVQDNLFVRNDAPCDPAAPGCGQPSTLQLFGPEDHVTITQNTIWQGDVLATLRDPGWGQLSITNNNFYRAWSDTSAPFGAGYSSSNNAVCRVEGTWPATGITTSCNPPFANPAADDFRTGDGRGVDWAPADQHYGP